MKVETGREAAFYRLGESVWLNYEKPFSSLGVAEMRDELLKINPSRWPCSKRPPPKSPKSDLVSMD